MEVVVDATDVVHEADEDNNRLAAQADLVVGDNLLAEFRMNRKPDEVFGVPVYVSDETATVYATIARASAPDVYLDDQMGNEISFTLVRRGDTIVDDQGNPVTQPDTVIIENGTMLYNPAAGFSASFDLAGMETGNYRVSITFTDGVQTVSTSQNFMIIAAAVIEVDTNRDVYIAGDPVLITGRALDGQYGTPIANETVILGIYPGSEGLGGVANPTIAALLGQNSDMLVEEVTTDGNGDFATVIHTHNGFAGGYTV